MPSGPPHTGPSTRLPGRRSALAHGQCLVRYRVREPSGVFYHARILVHEVDNDIWVILTPDGDLYVEDYSLPSADILAVIGRPDPMDIPHPLSRDQVHDFATQLDDNELLALRQEGLLLALRERRDRGIVVASGSRLAQQDAAVAATLTDGAGGAGTPAGGPPPLDSGPILPAQIAVRRPRRLQWARELDGGPCLGSTGVEPAWPSGATGASLRQCRRRADAERALRGRRQALPGVPRGGRGDAAG